jgi:hypothetical protein
MKKSCEVFDCIIEKIDIVSSLNPAITSENKKLVVKGLAIGVSANGMNKTQRGFGFYSCHLFIREIRVP